MHKVYQSYYLSPFPTPLPILLYSTPTAPSQFHSPPLLEPTESCMYMGMESPAEAWLTYKDLYS